MRVSPKNGNRPWMSCGGRFVKQCIRPRAFFAIVVILAGGLFLIDLPDEQVLRPDPTDSDEDLVADPDEGVVVGTATNLSGTAALPFLKGAQPNNTVVAVYHFLDNEDGAFGARWLYGVEHPSYAEDHVFFDLGRTMVVGTHQDLNEQFGLMCPCPFLKDCPMSKGRWKYNMRLLQKIFGVHDFPCTQVHPDAIERARSLGYDSIQITNHFLDTKNVTVMSTPQETAGNNSKFEIIDLTSNTVANWAGRLELPHYRTRSGKPCRMMSRKVLPEERRWFGDDQLLLACDQGAGADAAGSHGTGIGSCAGVRSRARFFFFSYLGFVCKTSFSNEKVECNPWDPDHFAANGCFFTVPCPGNFRGRGGTCARYTGRRQYPPRAVVPAFSSCAVVWDHGRLAGRGCGGDIDGHDGVFRVDVPRTHGAERDLGSRLNVSITSPGLANSSSVARPQRRQQRPGHRPSTSPTSPRCCWRRPAASSVTLSCAATPLPRMLTACSVAILDGNVFLTSSNGRARGVSGHWGLQGP
ncbi:unnamed protein product [Prorocentrum cordatum]|uniref:Phospholipase B-like n=1 Tax=Prorocentrum cordatum TaxID=2364126 RepID=A0ABN9YGK9_9DINO|nr:unnamed protein product [Polarella glacialis]